MKETQFYWFVELLGQPPKYLQGHHTKAYTHEMLTGWQWNFTENPHLADRFNKDQASVIAKEYKERGLNVEAREHGFMWVANK